MSRGEPCRARWIALVLLAVACAPAGPAAPETIVLVTIDTLRADHCEFLGYPAPTTPFLSALAAEGVSFEQAFTAASHTSPAHGSLFTSLYPDQHGARLNGNALADGVPTMAGALRERGFRTGAFTSVGFLSGLSAGFEVYDGHDPDEGDERAYRPAHETLDAAEAWLAERADGERAFVWVHLFDVHEWHQPAEWEEEWLAGHAVELALSEAERAAFYERAHGVERDAFESTAELLDAMAEYDRRLRYVDARLAAFRERTQALGRSDGALWIVTSDHGEGLGSHGYRGHGRELWREQLHVPLVVHGIGAPARGRRVPELVRLVDVWPTVAELVGVRTGRVEGRSFRALLEEGGAEPEPRLAYAQRRPATQALVEDGWTQERVRAVFDRGHKLIARSRAGDELYDLELDPLELDDRAEEEPAALARLRARLAELRGRIDRTRAGKGSKVPDSVRSELRRLGYAE